MTLIELLETEWAGKPDPFLSWDKHPDYILDVLRDWRRLALKESDWSQLPDVKLTQDKLLAWTTYRQALRDLPDTFNANGMDTQLPQMPV